MERNGHFRRRRDDSKYTESRSYWDNSNSLCQEQQREIKRTLDEQEKVITKLYDNVAALNSSSSLRDEQIRLMREAMAEEKRDRKASGLAESTARDALAKEFGQLREGFTEFKLSINKDMESMSTTICAKIDIGLAKIESKYDAALSAVETKSDVGLKELGTAVNKSSTRNFKLSITILSGIVISVAVGIAIFALNR
jgi:tyrosyl-tRNA synthetase